MVPSIFYSYVLKTFNRLDSLFKASDSGMRCEVKEQKKLSRIKARDEPVPFLSPTTPPLPRCFSYSHLVRPSPQSHEQPVQVIGQKMI